MQLGVVEPVPPDTAHASFTVPVKPPDGVTVMVELPVVVGELMAMGVPDSEKDGVAVDPAIVTARFTVFEIAPEAADMAAL